MIREIQGKIRARFEDSKEIPEAVDMIPNRVEPLVSKPCIKNGRLVPWIFGTHHLQ